MNTRTECKMHVQVKKKQPHTYNRDSVRFVKLFLKSGLVTPNSDLTEKRTSTAKPCSLRSPDLEVRPEVTFRELDIHCL